MSSNASIDFLFVLKVEKLFFFKFLNYIFLIENAKVEQSEDLSKRVKK